MKDINALPLETQFVLEYFNRTFRHLIADLGRKPTIDEFAFEMNMTIDDIEYYMEIAKDYFDFDNLPYREYDDKLIDFFDIDGYDTMQWLIVYNPAEDFIKKLYTNKISKLTKKELKILKLFWGILDGHAKTYKQVSLILDIKSKKIRQILKRATRKVLTQ